MTNWEDRVDDGIMMGRARPLFQAVNELRRRREEGLVERRPGVIPFLGRGIVPREARPNQQERVPGGNNYYIQNNRGRSRSFPTPPPNEIRSQPHSQLCCLTVGFGYVAPNACFPLRLNSPSHHAVKPPCPCPNYCPCHLPPPPPQNLRDTESSSSESTDSEDGNSLITNCGTS